MIKYLRYGCYMINMRFKGIKYNSLLKKKGEDEANEYAFGLYKKWAEYTNNIVGIETNVEGLENIPEGECVFMSNHTSIFDIPIIISLVNKRLGFIGKKELEKVPVAGFWANKGGNITIDRDNPREGMKAILKGVEHLNNGYSMVIFPEGTRSKTGELLEFKKGSLKLATKSKKTIVPVYIDGTNLIDKTKLKSKKKNIKVIFGEPIYTGCLSKEDERNLADNLFNIIKKLSNLN